MEKICRWIPVYLPFDGKFVKLVTKISFSPQQIFDLQEKTANINLLGMQT